MRLMCHVFRLCQNKHTFCPYFLPLFLWITAAEQKKAELLQQAEGEARQRKQAL